MADNAASVLQKEKLNLRSYAECCERGERFRNTSNTEMKLEPFEARITSPTTAWREWVHCSRK